ncbi:MAG: TIGR03032 family protein [Planctomycetaceae bacterium]|nr:TIGR03032 family protein [Planctomycetaceae bacterium]
MTLAGGTEGLWVVNTLFSCLCTLDETHSFVPRWKPSFISGLADEDRCHLNGMAMEQGRPRYVTVLAATDTAAGWRADKAKSGCLIDVQSGEFLSRGLCMPHSPRVHQQQLYVLNSGHGHLSHVDRRTGQLTPVEQMPGYTRGLAFHGQFAFVGLSRIRETNVFGGLPIGERREELCCGIAVIDMTSGRTVATFRFLSGVEEIFAVDVVPGFMNLAIGGSTKGEQQNEIWVVPPQSRL